MIIDAAAIPERVDAVDLYDFRESFYVEFHIPCCIGVPVMENSRYVWMPRFSGPDWMTGRPVGLEASLPTLVVGKGLRII
jgi:hypothetical protein